GALDACRSNGSRLRWRRRAGRRSSFLASCQRPVPPALAERTSHRAFPWVAEWRPPPCLAPALRSKTRESVSPSWLPGGKHECSGSPTGVKRTAKLSLLRNCDAPRKLANLDRLDDPEICDVDDGDVVRYAVGRQKIFFVGGKRHVPHALAHEKIFLDLVGRAVDHGDAIGGGGGHESGLAVPGGAAPHRLVGFLPHAPA